MSLFKKNVLMSNCLNNRLKHCLNFFYFATNCWCLLASAHASPEPSLHPVSGFSHINTHTHIRISITSTDIFNIPHLLFCPFSSLCQYQHNIPIAHDQWLSPHPALTPPVYLQPSGHPPSHR